MRTISHSLGLSTAVLTIVAMTLCCSPRANAQTPYGRLVYQDDFSVSNTAWTFKLVDTRDNPSAIAASYGKVSGGVLALKANVGCGWDYLGSYATLQLPLPTDYIIEYRARKMQWCGQFDAIVSSSTNVNDSHVFDAPWFFLRMEGNWFNVLEVMNTSDSQTYVPPVISSQENGRWYSFRIVRRTLASHAG
ncbi:MAG: hypothetical protein KA191_17135 [Verrucomicrobia bacterium]|nr:hypothetical protein [Verrucomicrobiota bacterium]OQC66011.1 MAG: hypothetical protein BWX48_01976 [Verrucomicrobia bacterium ADurb.Bin006]NMD21625.1 hypothetical protein [Verrucomicrobiota bacterium]HOA62627.1 hypothetical protein [Verrucomicrobiota bacterium]HOF49791.1 hypothetical protein [Verrucomicrobiota bacterium]